MRVEVQDSTSSIVGKEIFLPELGFVCLSVPVLPLSCSVTLKTKAYESNLFIANQSFQLSQRSDKEASVFVFLHERG